MLYEPTGSSASVQRPSEFVTALRVKLVATLDTVTAAPWMTAPFGSRTVPERPPVDCALAVIAAAVKNAMHMRHAVSLDLIFSPDADTSKLRKQRRSYRGHRRTFWLFKGEANR